MVVEAELFITRLTYTPVSASNDYPTALLKIIRRAYFNLPAKFKKQCLTVQIMHPQDTLYEF